MSEANHCIEDLFRANKDIRAVASMTDKYRKNVRYNIASSCKTNEHCISLSRSRIAYYISTQASPCAVVFVIVVTRVVVVVPVVITRVPP
jgi:hypothetical protein